ncbi:hypothetical protein [Roseomonas indoligenes]|uniref:Uncharacterized protein n=1 Tax=Roseomonas indoligenes TaxID=2820811 RepID=A0A940MXR3_9PROT|nr:hypothetical protein [Pararoseomonas indoligenes]MBP0494046.1 hypothetical protein [Pararoseomonas indoligenes]
MTANDDDPRLTQVHRYTREWDQWVLAQQGRVDRLEGLGTSLTLDAARALLGNMKVFQGMLHDNLRRELAMREWWRSSGTDDPGADLGD